MSDYDYDEWPSESWDEPDDMWEFSDDGWQDCDDDDQHDNEKNEIEYDEYDPSHYPNYVLDVQKENADLSKGPSDSWAIFRNC